LRQTTGERRIRTLRWFFIAMAHSVRPAGDRLSS
jgi:hypothetical protein